MRNKNEKGFTLVELLAVIVILAVIMIVAIPSVLDTMNTAKQKAFCEYAEKIYNKTLENLITSDVPNLAEYEAVVYSITDDLGYSATGDYHGYFVRLKTEYDLRYFYDKYKDYNKLDFLLLWNDDQVLFWNVTADGIPTIDRKWKSTDFLIETGAAAEANGGTNIASVLGATVGGDILLDRAKVEVLASQTMGTAVTLDNFEDKDNALSFFISFADGTYSSETCIASFAIVSGKSNAGYELVKKYEEVSTDCK